MATGAVFVEQFVQAGSRPPQKAGPYPRVLELGSRCDPRCMSHSFSAMAIVITLNP